LSDWFALDLLIHYGASRMVNVIINDQKNYVEKMKDFLQHYGRFNSYEGGSYEQPELREAHVPA
jgi:hypothetical protein